MMDAHDTGWQSIEPEWVSGRREMMIRSEWNCLNVNANENNRANGYDDAANGYGRGATYGSNR